MTSNSGMEIRVLTATAAMPLGAGITAFPRVAIKRDLHLILLAGQQYASLMDIESPESIKTYLRSNGLPCSGLQVHLTPLDAFEPFRVRFRDNTGGVTDTMCVYELLINIGQHQWQH